MTGDELAPAVHHGSRILHDNFKMAENESLIRVYLVQIPCLRPSTLITPLEST